MGKVYIPNIARKINGLAKSEDYRIGDLQKIRAELHNKRFIGPDIFRHGRHGKNRSVYDDYAYHYGGRGELQFNIGMDQKTQTGQDDWVRFGVAFSLQGSRSFPDIVDKLSPKIRLFNEYIQEHGEDFSDMRMWHVLKGRGNGDEYSKEYAPSAILSERVENNTFIFLGIKQQLDKLDYDVAIKAMDRLLPLYVFIESEGKSKRPELGGGFQFTPGHTKKRSSATASIERKEFDIQLKHNDIQEALYQRLAKEHGEKNVGTEMLNGRGTKVDVVVRHANDKYWFYEIKTASTAKACIRQAMGQLLEYAYWPGNQTATRLIVVGEPSLDNEAEQYIDTLKKEFSLPIAYQSVAS